MCVCVGGGVNFQFVIDGHLFFISLQDKNSLNIIKSCILVVHYIKVFLAVDILVTIMIDYVCKCIFFILPYICFAE